MAAGELNQSGQQHTISGMRIKKLYLEQLMERGEGSGSGFDSAGGTVWAKLVPLNSSYSDIELKSNELVVISEIKSPSSEKQEWCKITKEMDQISALMMNKRPDPILIDGKVVQKDDTTIIRCGSEIILGPEANGYMRYMFKVMPSEKTSMKKLKIMLDPEHAKCSICLNIWHDVVTVAPCLHNFCNGCFSEWLKRCQNKRSNVLCPQCRAVVQFAGRNHFLHSIEEDILQSDSSLRRSTEDIAVLDSFSSIKSPLVVCNGRKQTQKRARAPPEENHFSYLSRFSSFYISLICPQITEKCIRQMGKSLQDVISEWITKMGNREIDRSRLQLNQPDTNTPQTHVCRECYDKVVSYLLYWFRVTLPAHYLPPEAVQRVDCWYGYMCRTQHHNEEHARRNEGRFLYTLTSFTVLRC